MSYEEAKALSNTLNARGMESVVIAIPPEDGTMADYAVTAADPLQLCIPRVITDPNNVPRHLFNFNWRPAADTHHHDECRMSEGMAMKLSALLRYVKQPHKVVEFADESGDFAIMHDGDLLLVEAALGIVANSLGLLDE